MGRRSIVAAAIVVIAAGFALAGAWPWPRLASPSVRPLAVAEPRLAPEIAVADTLRRGETLSVLFARHGIDGLDLGRLVPALDPRRLRSGLVFRFTKPEPEAAATQVSLRSGGQKIELRRVANGWNASAWPVAWRTERVRLQGVVRSSIAGALDASTPDSVFGAEQRARLVWDLADVFAWQADFSHEVQPGDTVVVLAERQVSEDGDVHLGRILAADLEVGARHVTAFAYPRSTGDVAFYDADGRSLRRAFLAAPLQFRRISSTFSSARVHPVLGITRRHEGTDYAAEPGTPVLAVADGRVLRAGWSGGYGNLIELSHRGGITTRYGHLRRLATGIASGRAVHQGEVIGYVGATGLASGPHLHYEYRVGGIARDARQVITEAGEPIAAAERLAFDAERAALARLLYRTVAVATGEPELRLRGQ